jgi:hypothetical protein
VNRTAVTLPSTSSPRDAPQPAIASAHHKPVVLILIVGDA